MIPTKGTLQTDFTTMFLGTSNLSLLHQSLQLVGEISHGAGGHVIQLNIRRYSLGLSRISYIVAQCHGVCPGRGPPGEVPHLPPPVLHQVDVEVDGGAGDGEEMGDLADPETPGRPPHLRPAVRLGELPDVGHPADPVTHDEH